MKLQLFVQVMFLCMPYDEYVLVAPHLSIVDQLIFMSLFQLSYSLKKKKEVKKCICWQYML